MNIVLTVLIVIVVFGAVIFFHELGHFAVAKWSGIKVNEFAIGMGPRILKFGRKETIYALRVFPIGGFVSMEGEDEESEDARSFQRAAIWKRLLVIISGAFMNLVLGFLALVLLTALGIPDVIVSKTIAEVNNPDTGLQVGDVIKKVNGRDVFVYDDINYEFALTKNGSFDIEVEREGQRVLLEDVAFATQIAYQENGEPLIDEATGEPYAFLDIVSNFRVYGVEKNFFSVMGEAFNATLANGRLVYRGLFDMITGKVAVNQLMGPVGIVSEISKAVSYGWQPVVTMLAIISINLGLVNMLPLPALDGGKTVLLIIEAIRRKPMKQKYETVINIVGFGLLIALLLFVSFNDIMKLIF